MPRPTTTAPSGCTSTKVPNNERAGDLASSLMPTKASDETAILNPSGVKDFERG